MIDSSAPIDENALTALSNVLNICKVNNISCYVVASPFYFSTYTKSALNNRLSSMCMQFGARYLNYAEDARFIGKSYFFYDELHLNTTGANFFTAEICKELNADNTQLNRHK
jgi:hypothetical protein